MEFRTWPPPLEENPFHIMSNLKSRIIQVVKEPFERAQLELSMEGFVILMHLHLSQGMRQKQLAESIGRDKPSVTRALDVLENRGLLKRTVDSEDRRSHLVQITEKGIQYLNRSKPIIHGVFTQIFEPISESDYQVFLSVLQTLSLQLDTFAD